MRGTRQRGVDAEGPGMAKDLEDLCVAGESRSRKAVSSLSKYQAINNGTAIYIRSEGWMRVTPKFSQRRAPLLISPNSATPSSRTSPV